MIEINGKTRTCGLIGNPVEHTMSPLIHNFLAEEMGIEAVLLPGLPGKYAPASLGECIAKKMIESFRQKVRRTIDFPVQELQSGAQFRPK